LDVFIILPLISGVVALLFAGYLAMSVLRVDEGTEEMKKIAGAIRQGAKAFLSTGSTRLYSSLPSSSPSSSV
jgi:K(+)-stimulated pyrophosphate-energized sodium pump